MIRTIINDDEKWRSILRGLNKTFYHQTVTYSDIVDYISTNAGIDLTSVFAQYVQHTNIPTLELKVKEGKTFARWIADVSDFKMPVNLRSKGGEYKLFSLDRKWREIPLQANKSSDIEVDTFNFYVGVLAE